MATGAGQLFEHVAFDMREQVDDGHGNYEQTFVEQFNCRAGFTYLRGGEAVIAGRLEGKQPIVVRVRVSSQSKRIATDWQMRDMRNGAWANDGGNQYWTGPVYAVRSVIPTTDRQWIDVTVEGGVAA